MLSFGVKLIRKPTFWQNLKAFPRASEVKRLVKLDNLNIFSLMSSRRPPIW